MTDEELCKNEFEKWFLLDEDISNKNIKWCAWQTSWKIRNITAPTPAPQRWKLVPIDVNDRAIKLLLKGVPFFVVKASEPYAKQVVELIKQHEGEKWTAEDETWANKAMLSAAPTPAQQTPASDVAKEPFPILPKTDGREHRQSTVIILGQWFLRNYYLVERALQPTYWMPLPAPICKSCTNGMSYGVDGEYPCPKCHGNNAPTEKVERIEGLFDAVSVEDLPPPNTDEECENIVKRYHDHANIYGCDVSETLLKAARAYIKQQSGETEKVDYKELRGILKPYMADTPTQED